MTTTTNETAPRSTNVAGRSYIQHIAADGRTLCGRVAAKVNCVGTTMPSDEGLCRVCRQKRDASK